MFMLPMPRYHERREGDFAFADTIFVTLPKEICGKTHIKHLCELASGYTAGRTKAEFVISEKLSGCAVISKKPWDSKLCLATEYDYELHCEPESITLVFSDRVGFVHGFVSFLQLIRIERQKDAVSFRVPCYVVKDSPDMAFRAIHLCVFHKTSLDFLKKAISLCGIMKCSHVVLEFWGMYRFECCPSLSWKEAYTKDDIKPVIDLANSLGLEVIPMLNHLGHASQARICSGKHSALDNDLSLAPYFEEDGWSWCTSNPETLSLLAQCRKELIELCGEGKYFHIGCDEAYTFGSCDKCSKRSRNELMLEHLTNITQELKKYGRRPIMWADMLFNKADFEKEYEIYGKDEYKIRPMLARDIIMADWQYNITHEFETSLDLKKDGFDVVTCPWNSRVNVSAAVDTAKSNKLLGVLGTTWHTLSQMQWLIPYIADRMWGNAHPLTDQEYTLYCSYNVRRCVPANGEYEKAGFLEEELA